MLRIIAVVVLLGAIAQVVLVFWQRSPAATGQAHIPSANGALFDEGSPPPDR